MSGKKGKRRSVKSKKGSSFSTTKEERSAIAAKRKRLGLSAADSDDAGSGKAYDPQALCIAHHREILDIFESHVGSVHGSMDYSEFRTAIDSMNLPIGSGDALKAFTEVHEDDDVDLEAFMNAVHIAHPTYDLLWQQIFKKSVKYQPSLEVLLLSEIKAIMSHKKGEWREKTRALRYMTTLICKPHQEDIDTTKLIKQLTGSFTAAFRSNHQCVIREVCFSLATIAKTKPNALKGSIIKLLNLCWEILDVRLPLIRYSAKQLTQALIKYVPDTKDNKVLKTLLQGLSLKDFRNVQEACYLSILVMMKKNSNPKINVNPQFWSIVKSIISNGLKDIQANETNNRSYLNECTFELMIAFEKFQPSKASRLFESLNNQAQTKFNDYKTSSRSATKFMIGSPAVKTMTKGIEFDAMDLDGKNNNNEADGDDDGWSRSITKAKKGKHVLKTTYDGLKTQLEFLVEAYDGDDDGILNVNETLVMLKDLCDLHGPPADIALRGLDNKKTGHIKQQRIFKYIIEHQEAMQPNPMIEKDAEQFGWTSGSKQDWVSRIQIYEQLMEVEKQDHNYTAMFDMDHKLCVLKYLLKNS